MHRRATRYVLDLLLLGAVAVVLLTGLVADRLDLNGFALHRIAGCVAALLVAIHVALHWRWFLPIRPADRRRPDVAVAAPTADQTRPPESLGVVTHPTVAASGSDGAVADGIAAVQDREVAPGPRALEPPPARLSRRAALTATGAGVAGVAAGWLARGEVTPDPFPGGDVGLFYHRESSLGLRGLVAELLEGGGRQPDRYKVVGDGQAVALPDVTTPPDMSLARALEQRRSLRDYAQRPLTAAELAWVVSSATRITSASGYRTSPSAGALYPIEVYVAVNRVAGIDPGLFHVNVRAQSLETVRAGAVAGDLMIAGLGQEFLRKAPAVLILTGVFGRTRWKYRQRHYRYVCWEGGHIAQTVYLAAEAAGLGACMVGAFLDGAVNDLLGVDGRQEAALGLIAVGPRP